MNKKEVSLFLTAITGRLLCATWSDFFEWARVRLNRTIDIYGRPLSKEITDSITDAEWHEIADFFIEAEEVKEE